MKEVEQQNRDYANIINKREDNIQQLQVKYWKGC